MMVDVKIQCVLCRLCLSTMNTLIPPPLGDMSPTAQHYLSTVSASSDPVPGRPMTTPLQAPRNVLQLLGYFDNTLPTVHGYVDPARLDGDGAWRDRFLGFGEGVPWTRQTHTPGLPDSLLGRNPYMMSTINASVIGSGDFYAGELLPYSDAGHIHVAWDVLRMNEQLAHRSPEEGVTRLLTWEKHTRTQNAVRRGLAMQLDSDTFHTPEGARHFMMELDGLIRAVRATINLDVMTALMDCAQQRDAREEGAKRYRGVAGLTRVPAREIDSYAMLQSRAHGLEILIAEAREQMSRRGASPDTVILPPGAVAFLSQRPEYQGAFSAYSRRVGAQVYGCKVYEAEYVCVGDRGSTTAGERDMRCPLVRPTDVGERYHVTDGGAVSLSVLDACNTALTLYSEIQDRWIDVPMRKLLTYGNNRFGGTADGGVYFKLRDDPTLEELATWASEWWDKLCGALMPRDGRMLLRPDWLLWRDWSVKSGSPKSYKTVATMWHLSQAQFPSLFTPLSLAVTRSMQADAFQQTVHTGMVADGYTSFAGELANGPAKHLDTLLWFAVAQTFAVAGAGDFSACSVPCETFLIEQGRTDVWQNEKDKAQSLSLGVTSAYWHYVTAQHKGRAAKPHTVGALYESCVGSANAVGTAAHYGCGANVVDAHHFQISLLMWHFVHMYEEHCVTSGFAGSLRNGTLSTLHNFVGVLFRQSQDENKAYGDSPGETEVKRLALQKAVARVERAENAHPEFEGWLRDARAVVESGDDRQLGLLLRNFEEICDYFSLDASRYVYPLPNVWAALLEAVGSCKIAGSDADTLTRVVSALERADARFAERVASCVGGRGVVDVGKEHVKCPTRVEMPASIKRRRGEGAEVEEEDAARSAVAARIEDVTYMAALFAVYACDLFSASVGAASVPLAAHIPDAVLDTYAREWHRVYHLTEGSRLSVFDDAYLQASLGDVKCRRRLHGCAMALSLISDGIFSVLGSAALDCYDLQVQWRPKNLTERASKLFGPGTRVTAALAVPPTSLALLLFVSRAYADLAHRNEECDYPPISDDVYALFTASGGGKSARPFQRRRTDSRTEHEEMESGERSFALPPGYEVPHKGDPWYSTPRQEGPPGRKRVSPEGPTPQRRRPPQPRESDDESYQQEELPQTPGPQPDKSYKRTKSPRKTKRTAGPPKGLYDDDEPSAPPDVPTFLPSQEVPRSTRPRQVVSVSGEADTSNAQTIVALYCEHLYDRATLVRDAILCCDYASLSAHVNIEYEEEYASFEDHVHLMEASTEFVRVLLNLCEGARDPNKYGVKSLYEIIDEDLPVDLIVEGVVQAAEVKRPTDMDRFGLRVESLENSFAMFFVANECVTFSALCESPNTLSVYMHVMEKAQKWFINESVCAVGACVSAVKSYGATHDGLELFCKDAEVVPRTENSFAMPHDLQVACALYFSDFWNDVVTTAGASVVNERRSFAKHLALMALGNDLSAVRVNEAGKFAVWAAQQHEEPQRNAQQLERFDDWPTTTAVDDSDAEFAHNMFAEIAAACTATLGTSVDYRYLLRDQLCNVQMPANFEPPSGAPDSMMVCVFAESVRLAFHEVRNDDPWTWLDDKALDVRQWVSEGTCLLNFLHTHQFRVPLARVVEGLFAVATKLALSRGVHLRFGQFDVFECVTEVGAAWMVDSTDLIAARRVYGAQIDDSLWAVLCAVASRLVEKKQVTVTTTDALENVALDVPPAMQTRSVRVAPQTWFSPSVYAFPATCAFKFSPDPFDVYPDAATIDVSVLQDLESVRLWDVDIDGVVTVLTALAKELNTTDSLDPVTAFDFALLNDMLSLEGCRRQLRINLFKLQNEDNLSLGQQEVTNRLRATLVANNANTTAAVLLSALDLQTGGLVANFFAGGVLAERGFQFESSVIPFSNRQAMRPDNLTLVLHSLQADPLLQMANTKLELLVDDVVYAADGGNMNSYKLRGTDVRVHSDFLLSWEDGADNETVERMYVSFCDQLLATEDAVSHDDVWWWDLYKNYKDDQAVLRSAFEIEHQYLAQQLRSFKIVARMMFTWFDTYVANTDEVTQLATVDDENMPVTVEPEDSADLRGLKALATRGMKLNLLDRLAEALQSVKITPYVQHLFLQEFSYQKIKSTVAEDDELQHAVFLHDTSAGFPTAAALSDRETEMRYYADAVLEGRFQELHKGSIKPYRAETAARMFNCGDMSPPVDDGFVEWQQAETGAIVHMLVLFAGVSVDTLLTNDDGNRLQSWKELRGVQQLGDDIFRKAEASMKSRTVCVALTTDDRRRIIGASETYRSTPNSTDALRVWHETVVQTLKDRAKEVQTNMGQELGLYKGNMAAVSNDSYKYCVYKLYVAMLTEMQHCVVGTLNALIVSVNLMYKLELEAIFNVSLNAVPFVPPLSVQCHKVTIEEWLQGEARCEDKKEDAAEVYDKFVEQKFESQQRCVNGSGLLQTHHAAASTSTYAVGAAVELARIVQQQRYELCDPSENYAKDWLNSVQAGPFALCQTVLDNAKTLEARRSAHQSRDISEVKNDGAWRASQFALAALAYRTGEYGSDFWKETLSGDFWEFGLNSVDERRKGFQDTYLATLDASLKEMAAGMKWYRDAVFCARAAALDPSQAFAMAAPSRVLLCGVLAQTATVDAQFLANLCAMGDENLSNPFVGQCLHNSPSAASVRASLRYGAAEDMLNDCANSQYVSEEEVARMGEAYSLDARYQRDSCLAALSKEFDQVKSNSSLRRALALANGIDPFRLSALNDDVSLLREMEAQVTQRFERNYGLKYWGSPPESAAELQAPDGSLREYRNALRDPREAGADLFVASLWQPSCDIAEIYSTGAELLHAKRDWWALHANPTIPDNLEQCKSELLLETYNDFNGEMPMGAMLNSSEREFAVGLALRGLFCGAASQCVYEGADARLEGQCCAEIARVVLDTDEYNWHALSRVDALTNKMRGSIDSARGQLLDMIGTALTTGALAPIEAFIREVCGKAQNEALRLAGGETEIAHAALVPLFRRLRRDCQQAAAHASENTEVTRNVQKHVEAARVDAITAMRAGVYDGAQGIAYFVSNFNEFVDLAPEFGNVFPAATLTSQQSLEIFEQQSQEARRVVTDFKNAVHDMVWFLYQCDEDDRVSDDKVVRVEVLGDSEINMSEFTVIAGLVTIVMHALYPPSFLQSFAESIVKIPGSKADTRLEYVLQGMMGEVADGFEKLISVDEWEGGRSKVATEIVKSIARYNPVLWEEFSKAYVGTIVGEALSVFEREKPTDQVRKLLNLPLQMEGQSVELVNVKTKARFRMDDVAHAFRGFLQQAAAVDESLESAYVNAVIDDVLVGSNLWGIVVFPAIDAAVDGILAQIEESLQFDVARKVRSTFLSQWQGLQSKVAPLNDVSGVYTRVAEPRNNVCRDNARLMQLCGDMVERYGTDEECHGALRKAMQRFSTTAVDSRGLVKATAVEADGLLTRRARGVAETVDDRTRFDLEQLSLHESTFAARSCTHQLSALCSHVDWGQRDGRASFVVAPDVDTVLDVDSARFDSVQRYARTLAKGLARKVRGDDNSPYVVTVDMFDTVWCTPLDAFRDALNEVTEDLLADLPTEMFLIASATVEQLQALQTFVDQLDFLESIANLELLLQEKNAGMYSPLIAQDLLLHMTLVEATGGEKWSGNDWELTRVLDAAFYNEWVAVLGAGAKRRDGIHADSLLSLDPCGYIHFSSAQRYASLSHLYTARAANGADSANPRWDEERHVRAVLRRDVAHLVEGDTSRQTLSPHMIDIYNALQDRLADLADGEVVDMHEFAMFPSSMYSNKRVRVRKAGQNFEMGNPDKLDDFQVATIDEIYAAFLRCACDQDTPTYGDSCFALLADHMAAFGRDSMVDLHYKQPTVGSPAPVDEQELLLDLVRTKRSTPFSVWMSHSLLAECYKEGRDHQVMFAAFQLAGQAVGAEMDDLYGCVTNKPDLIQWLVDTSMPVTTQFYAQWSVAYKKIATSFRMEMSHGETEYAQELCIAPQMSRSDRWWTWLSLRTLEDASEPHMLLRAKAQAAFATSRNSVKLVVVAVLTARSGMVLGAMTDYGIDTDKQPDLHTQVSLLVLKLVETHADDDDVALETMAEEYLVPGISLFAPRVTQYVNFALLVSFLTQNWPHRIAELQDKLLAICAENETLMYNYIATTRVDIATSTRVSEQSDAPSTGGLFTTRRFLGSGIFTDRVLELAQRECADVADVQISAALQDYNILSYADPYASQKPIDPFNTSNFAYSYLVGAIEALVDQIKRRQEAGVTFLRQVSLGLQTAAFYDEVQGQNFALAGKFASYVHSLGMYICFAGVSNQGQTIPEAIDELARSVWIALRENFAERLVYFTNQDQSQLDLFVEDHLYDCVVLPLNDDAGFSAMYIQPGNEDEVQALKLALFEFATEFDDMSIIEDARVAIASNFVEKLTANTGIAVNDFAGAITRAMDICERNHRVFALIEQCSACAQSLERTVSQCTDAVVNQMETASNQLVMKAHASGCDSLAGVNAQQVTYCVRSWQQRTRPVEYGVAKTLGVLQTRFSNKLEEFVNDTRTGKNALGQSYFETDPEDVDQNIEYLRSCFCMQMPSATPLERRQPLWLFKALQSESQLSVQAVKFQQLFHQERVEQNAKFVHEWEVLALKWHWCCIDTAGQSDGNFVDAENPQTVVEGVHGEHDTQVGCRTPFEHERDVRNFLHPSNLLASISCLEAAEVLPHNSSSSFSWLENGSAMTLEGLCLFVLSNSDYFRQSVDSMDPDLQFLAVDTQCSILQYAGLNETGGECAFPGMYGDCRHLLHQPRVAADRACALMQRIRAYGRSWVFEEAASEERHWFTWAEVTQAMQARASARVLLQEMVGILYWKIAMHSDIVAFVYKIEHDECEMARILADFGLRIYEDTVKDLVSPTGDNPDEEASLALLPRTLVVGKLPGQNLYVQRGWWGQLIAESDDDRFGFLPDGHTKRKLESAHSEPTIASQSVYFSRIGRGGCVKLKVYSCSAQSKRASMIERTLAQHFTSVNEPYDNVLRVCYDGVLGDLQSTHKLQFSAIEEVPLDQHRVGRRLLGLMSEDDGLERALSMRERRSLIDVCPTIYGSARLCTLRRTADDEPDMPRDDGEINEAMRAMHVGTQMMRTPMSAQVDAAVRRRLEATYEGRGYAYTRAVERGKELTESLAKYYGDPSVHPLTEPITAVEVGTDVYDRIATFIDQDAAQFEAIRDAMDVYRDKGPLAGSWVEELLDVYTQKRIRDLTASVQREQECRFINKQRAVNADAVKDRNAYNRQRDSSFYYGRWVAEVTTQPDVFTVVTAACEEDLAESHVSAFTDAPANYLQCTKTEMDDLGAISSLLGQLKGAIEASAKSLHDLQETRGSTMSWLDAAVLSRHVVAVQYLAESIPDEPAPVSSYGAVRKQARDFVEVYTVTRQDIRRIVDADVYELLEKAYDIAHAFRSAVADVQVSCASKFTLAEISSGALTAFKKPSLPETYLFRYMFDDIFVNLATALAQNGSNVDDLLLAFAMQPPVFFHKLQSADVEKEFAAILDTAGISAVAVEEGRLSQLCMACSNAGLGQRRYDQMACDALRTPYAIRNAAMYYLGYELAYSSMSANRQRLWEYTLFDSVVASSAVMNNEFCFNHSVARYGQIMRAHREIIQSMCVVDSQQLAFSQSRVDELADDENFYKEDLFTDAYDIAVRSLNGEVFVTTLEQIVRHLERHHLSLGAVQRTVKGEFTMLLQHDVLATHVLERFVGTLRPYAYLRLVDATKQLPEMQRGAAVRDLNQVEEFVLYRDPDLATPSKYGVYGYQHKELPFLDLNTVRSFVAQVQMNLPASYSKCHFERAEQSVVLPTEEPIHDVSDRHRRFASLAAGLVNQKQHPRIGFVPMGPRQYVYALMALAENGMTLRIPCKYKDTFVQPADRLLEGEADAIVRRNRFVDRAVAGITAHVSRDQLYSTFQNREVSTDYFMDDSHLMAVLEDRAPVIAAERALVTFDCALEPVRAYEAGEGFATVRVWLQVPQATNALQSVLRRSDTQYVQSMCFASLENSQRARNVLSDDRDGLIQGDKWKTDLDTFTTITSTSSQDRAYGLLFASKAHVYAAFERVGGDVGDWSLTAAIQALVTEGVLVTFEAVYYEPQAGTSWICADGTVSSALLKLCLECPSLRFMSLEPVHVPLTVEAVVPHRTESRLSHDFAARRQSLLNCDASLSFPTQVQVVPQLYGTIAAQVNNARNADKVLLPVRFGLTCRFTEFVRSENDDVFVLPNTTRAVYNQTRLIAKEMKARVDSLPGTESADDSIYEYVFYSLKGGATELSKALEAPDVYSCDVVKLQRVYASYDLCRAEGDAYFYSNYANTSGVNMMKHRYGMLDREYVDDVLFAFDALNFAVLGPHIKEMDHGLHQVQVNELAAAMCPSYLRIFEYEVGGEDVDYRTLEDYDKLRPIAYHCGVSHMQLAFWWFKRQELPELVQAGSDVVERLDVLLEGTQEQPGLLTEDWWKAFGPSDAAYETNENVLQARRQYVNLLREQLVFYERNAAWSTLSHNVGIGMAGVTALWEMLPPDDRSNVDALEALANTYGHVLSCFNVQPQVKSTGDLSVAQSAQRDYFLALCGSLLDNRNTVRAGNTLVGFDFDMDNPYDCIKYAFLLAHMQTLPGNSVVQQQVRQAVDKFSIPDVISSAVESLDAGFNGLIDQFLTPDQLEKQRLLGPETDRYELLDLALQERGDSNEWAGRTLNAEELQRLHELNTAIKRINERHEEDVLDVVHLDTIWQLMQAKMANVVLSTSDFVDDFNTSIDAVAITAQDADTMCWMEQDKVHAHNAHVLFSAQESAGGRYQFTLETQRIADKTPTDVYVTVARTIETFPQGAITRATAMLAYGKYKLTPSKTEPRVCYVDVDDVAIHDSDSVYVSFGADLLQTAHICRAASTKHVVPKRKTCPIALNYILAHSRRVQAEGLLYTSRQMWRPSVDALGFSGGRLYDSEYNDQMQATAKPLEACRKLTEDFTFEYGYLPTERSAYFVPPVAKMKDDIIRMLNEAVWSQQMQKLAIRQPDHVAMFRSIVVKSLLGESLDTIESTPGFSALLNEDFYTKVHAVFLYTTRGGVRGIEHMRAFFVTDALKRFNGDVTDNPEDALKRIFYDRVFDATMISRQQLEQFFPNDDATDALYEAGATDWVAEVALLPLTEPELDEGNDLGPYLNSEQERSLGVIQSRLLPTRPTMIGAGDEDVSSVSVSSSAGTTLSKYLQLFTEVLWYGHSLLRQTALVRNYSSTDAGCYLAAALALTRARVDEVHHLLRRFVRRNSFVSAESGTPESHVRRNLKLHVVATRPVIRHMMGATIVMKRGESTGRTLIGPENDFQIKQLPEPAGGQYYGNLTFYSKAFVQEHKNVHVKTGSFAVAYMNGNDTGPLCAVKSGAGNPLALAGDILTCVLPESYDKAYSLRGCNGLQEDIFGVWSDAMASVADCADAVDGSNGVHFACGPYNYMHLRGWQTMANRPCYLHMKTTQGSEYSDSIVHDWTDKRSSGFFGCERNTICYPGPHVALAIDALQRIDSELARSSQLLQGDRIAEEHYEHTQRLFAAMPKPERACHGSGHWKNSVGVGFAGGRSGRYDALDRRNAHMPAYAYGSVEPGEYNTSGRPTIVAATPLAGVYGAHTNLQLPSLGTVLNGATY